MNYAFVIQHINALGGTERSACAVMNGLARDGANVHLIELFSRGPSAFALEPGIGTVSLFPVHVLIFNSWFRIVSRLARELRARRIDVLIVVESTHSLYGVAAARLAGVRCVVWEHFNHNVTLGRRKRVWGRRIAARWAHDVVVLTTRDAALWRQAGVRARVTAIPNIAPDVVPAKAGARRDVVLAVGRLTSQKGYDLLLQAWAQVLRDAHSAGWSLLIRGDGEERDALMRQAAGLARVEIAPATRDVARDYAESAIFVCSSRYEGLPMVLLEASAHGLPIVGFDCETGPAEIVSHGESGILVPPLDVAGLAEALLAMMADPQARARMGAAGRERVRAFGVGPVVARWKRLLERG